MQVKAKTKPAINIGMFTSAAPMTITGMKNIPEISIVAASSVELFICLILPCVDNLHITIGYYTVNPICGIYYIV